MNHGTNITEDLIKGLVRFRVDHDLLATVAIRVADDCDNARSPVNHS